MEALIETRVTTLEANFLGMKDDTAEIKGDVREIRRALTARPSWAVALALTFMSSLTVGFGAIALAGH